MREGGGLLERLAAAMAVEYLSDLRRPDRRRRERLVRLLRGIPASAAPAQEWNDALQYLLGLPPAQSGPEAREQLLRGLDQSRDGDLFG